MSLLAPFLVPGFLGEQWILAVPVVQVLAAVSALQTLSAILPQLALARSENKLLTQRSLIMFAVRVPVVALGVVLYGLPGCLIGLCVAGIVGLAMNLVLARRLIGLSIEAQIAPHLNTFLATLCMSGLLLLARAEVAHASASNVVITVIMTMLGALAYVVARIVIALVSRSESIVEHELWLLIKRAKASP